MVKMAFGRTRHLRVGVVGCGLVSELHLSAWKKMSQVKECIVCDTNEQAAQYAAKRWQSPRYYTSLSELLSREKVSIVDICTPPKTHLPLIIEAIEAGCHVLVEKPLTLRAKDVEEIRARIKDSGLKLCTVHNITFYPEFTRLKSALESGKLGEVTAIEEDFAEGAAHPVLIDEKHWSHSLPGGIFSELLPHPVYLLVHLFNHLEVESVMVKKLGKYSWIKADELNVTLRAEKVQARIHLSFNYPSRSSLNMTRVYGKGGILLANHCTHSLIKFSSPITVLSSKLGGAYETAKEISSLSASLTQNVGRVLRGRWRPAHEACIRQFLESIEKDEEPPVTLEMAYETVRIVEEVCMQIQKKFTLGMTADAASGRA